MQRLVTVVVLAAVVVATGACKEKPPGADPELTRVLKEGELPSFDKPAVLAKRWDFLDYKPDAKRPSLQRPRPILAWVYIERDGKTWDGPFNADIVDLTQMSRRPANPYALYLWQGAADLMPPRPLDGVPPPHHVCLATPMAKEAGLADHQRLMPRFTPGR